MKRLVPNSKEEKKVLQQCLVIAGGLVILDHITKLLVIEKIPLYHSIPVIPNCFNLVYVTNKGAAWGMLSGYSWLLLTTSLVVFGLIIYFYRYLTEGWQERYYALAMIVSGIIGNSIDRVFRKAVVDFLDFYIGASHWPAFNVADSAITVGVTIMIISNLFRPQKDTASDKSSTSKSHS